MASTPVFRYISLPRLRRATAAAARREDDKVADPEVYGSTWHAATAVAREPRPRLNFDLDVDVCVIGGGLAGLTTARELARRGWDVAVLEAQRVAWSASGRQGGVVLPGFDQSVEKIIDRVGLAHARELWSLSERGVDYVRRASAHMPGVHPVQGYLDVSTTAPGDIGAERVRLLRQDIGVDVEHWPADRVRALLQSELYGSALHYARAFHIHPLNYAFGLAAAAEAEGVRIFEQTPALAIDPAGVRKRVATPSARVRAAHVVLAGGARLGGLLPRVASTVLPVTSYTVTTKPLGDRLDAAIGFHGAIADGDENRYRIAAGDRLQWQGRLSTWDADPRRLARALRRDIARVYPQLGGVEVAHAWSATVGVPVHRMPQLGQLSPGLWLAGGFGSQGFNTTAMAGELIARAIAEHDTTWRLFMPFELVWAGGLMGRTVVQVMAWGDRVGRAVETGLARRPRLRRPGRKPVVDPPDVPLAPATPAASLPAVAIPAEIADQAGIPQANARPGVRPSRKRRARRAGDATVAG